MLFLVPGRDRKSSRRDLIFAPRWSSLPFIPGWNHSCKRKVLNFIPGWTHFSSFKMAVGETPGQGCQSGNLVPRAFSSFKMAVGETPGQGCWNTPRIVEYFVTWHKKKWLFRRLFPASGSPVCFLQSETVVQMKRSQFIAFTRRNSNEFLEPP